MTHEEVEEKLDRITCELIEINELLDQIARHHGITS